MENCVLFFGQIFLVIVVWIINKRGIYYGKK